MSETSQLSAEELIRRLGLRPLPEEGGHFVQSWVADESVAAEALPPRYSGARPLGAAIYYLLSDAPDSFSALHRLASDEVYHFYLGDPVELLLLHPGGHSQCIELGRDLLGGQQVQCLAPRATWQGSRVVAGGRWALLGTTMSPGFDTSDFELGRRASLAAGWPDRAALIGQLTRG